MLRTLVEDQEIDAAEDLIFRCRFSFQVNKLHQEKLHLIADKDLQGNFDRFQIEEMVQVSVLCTQFQPGHRPKMCDVLRYRLYITHGVSCACTSSNHFSEISKS